MVYKVICDQDAIASRTSNDNQRTVIESRLIYRRRKGNYNNLTVYCVLSDAMCEVWFGQLDL